MRFFAIFLTAWMLIGQTEIHAALPPLYESLAELKTIINSPQLSSKLVSGELIIKIEKNEEGYLITTNKHTLQAIIEYQAAQRPGPQNYKVRFGEPSSL